MLRNNPMNNGTNGPRWAWLAKTALGIAGSLILAIASLSAAILWDLRTEMQKTREQSEENGRLIATALAEIAGVKAEMVWRVAESDRKHASYATREEMERAVREAWSDWTRRDTRFDRKREAGVP